MNFKAIVGILFLPGGQKFIKMPDTVSMQKNALFKKTAFQAYFNPFYKKIVQCEGFEDGMM